MAARLVLAGFGDLNSRVARRWREDGGDVVAMRLSQADAESPVKQVQVDLSGEIWPDLQADYLVVALSAKTRSLEGYQKAYLEPIQQLKQSLIGWREIPKKIIVVSSSRVFAEQQGEQVDDTTYANSADPYAKILMNMELELHSIETTTCAATLSGIYSSDRNWFKRIARNAEQEPPKTNHWTNRIHIEDAAAALVHLLALDDIPERVLVSDTKPMPFYDVINFLREKEQLPALKNIPDIEGGKRLAAEFLKNSGFKWQYPSAFSGGYD